MRLPVRGLPAVGARTPALSVEHRVKLRSSILAGFVSFNSLFDGTAIPGVRTVADIRVEMPRDLHPGRHARSLRKCA
jgi:hypothetical protein